MSNDDTQLTEFLLGTLNKDAHEVVSRDIETSPDKRNALQSTQDALDHIGLEQEPINTSKHLRDLIMGAIDPSSRFEGFVERLAELFDLSSKRIRELLSTIDDDQNQSWKASGIPGTRLMHFDGGPRLESATCGLVTVKPGRIFPAHKHQDDEWVFVLQGRAQEDSGRILEPGDLDYGKAGTTHTFRTLGEESFIFAVVLFKDNKWLFGRTVMDHIQAKKRFGPDKPS